MPIIQTILYVQMYMSESVQNYSNERQRFFVHFLLAFGLSPWLLILWCASLHVIP
jgi:hypothetical protein